MKKTLKQMRSSQGFTLIELLLVIAIIAILAAVIFVALDPLKRFQDTRDSRRWSEVEEILHAVKIDQIDNRGKYIDEIQNATSSIPLMITDGIATTTTDFIGNCTAVTAVGNVVDLSGLVTEGYLADVPVSPSGPNTTPNWAGSGTGYYLTKDPAGFIKITACESEGGDNIEVQR